MLPQHLFYPGPVRLTIQRRIYATREVVCQYKITLDYYQCSSRRMAGTQKGDNYGEYWSGSNAKATRCNCRAQQERLVAAETEFVKDGNHNCKATMVFVENLFRSIYAYMNAKEAGVNMKHCLQGC